jgi:hypothetical protein
MKSNNFLNIKFLAALTGSFIGLTGCSTDAELGAGSEVHNSASKLGKNMPAGNFFCNLNLDEDDKPSTSWRYEISYTKNTFMPSSVNIVVFKNGKKISTVNAPALFSDDKAVRYEKKLDEERKIHVTIYKSLPFNGGHGASLGHQLDDRFWASRSGFCTKK